MAVRRCILPLILAALAAAAPAARAAILTADGVD
jgi:hypothetical protein